MGDGREDLHVAVVGLRSLDEQIASSPWRWVEHAVGGLEGPVADLPDSEGEGDGAEGLAVPGPGHVRVGFGEEAPEPAQGAWNGDAAAVLV